MSRAQKRAQVTGLEACLSNPTCRGTRTVSPRNPFFCGNALLHFRAKPCIIETTTKKAGRKGAGNTRPALCRRIPLSHTADITAPVFHYTPFYAFSQGGECSCALVSGVGNRNPCAAFVVSRESRRGPGMEVPPPNG